MSDEPRIFHLLQRAHGALFRAADRRLQAAAGLTATQHGVLLALASADGQPIGAVAETLKMGKSSLTGLVGRLLAEGLVRRETDDADMRVQRLHLTRKGRAAVEATLADVRRINATLLAPYSARERSLIVEFLNRIAEEGPSIVLAEEATQRERKRKA